MIPVYSLRSQGQGQKGVASQQIHSRALPCTRPARAGCTTSETNHVRRLGLFTTGTKPSRVTSLLFSQNEKSKPFDLLLLACGI